MTTRRQEYLYHLNRAREFRAEAHRWMNWLDSPRGWFSADARGAEEMVEESFAMARQSLARARIVRPAVSFRRIA